MTTLTADSEQPAQHCSMCGDTHRGECHHSSFAYYKCDCGKAQRMPFDASMMGLGNCYCTCNRLAETAWSSISHDEYLKLAPKETFDIENTDLEKWIAGFRAELERISGLTGPELDKCLTSELENWTDDDQDWKVWKPEDAANENVSYWDT